MGWTSGPSALPRPRNAWFVGATTDPLNRGIASDSQQLGKTASLAPRFHRALIRRRVQPESGPGRPLGKSQCATTNQ